MVSQGCSGVATPVSLTSRSLFNRRGSSVFLYRLLARAEARTQQERDRERQAANQREQGKGHWPGGAHRGHDAINEQDEYQCARRHPEYGTEDEMPESDMRRAGDQIDD